MAKKTVHVPCPESVLTEAQYDAFIAANGNKILTVEFFKVDGSPRTINGQLRSVSRLVGNEAGKVQGERMKADGQVWIAKPDGSSGSFYKNRIKSIRAGGAILSAR